MQKKMSSAQYLKVSEGSHGCSWPRTESLVGRRGLPSSVLLTEQTLHGLVRKSMDVRVAWQALTPVATCD